MVEVDFGGNTATTLAVVRNNGSVAICATQGDRTPKLPVRDLMQRNIALYGVVLPTSPHEARRRAQSDIARWVASGKRILSVAASFPLDETAAAHSAVEQGGKIGTVVVEPQH